MLCDALWGLGILSDAVWCLVTLCDAEWRLVMLCDVVWCLVMLCDAVWCRVMPCEALWGLVMLCDAVWCLVIFWVAEWRLVRLCDVVWCLVKLRWCCLMSCDTQCVSLLRPAMSCDKVLGPYLLCRCWLRNRRSDNNWVTPPLVCVGCAVWCVIDHKFHAVITLFLNRAWYMMEKCELPDSYPTAHCALAEILPETTVRA